MREPAGTTGTRPVRLRLALSLAAVLATAACGSAGAEVEGSGSPAPTTTEAPAELGTPATDSSLTFTVEDVDCSQETLGDLQAQGVFCVVSVDITNDGDAPQSVDVTAQRAYDAQDNEYSGVPGVGATVPEAAFPAELEPGGEASGDLVFDVPPGTELTQLQLHDGPTSTGVTVDLQ